MKRFFGLLLAVLLLPLPVLGETLTLSFVGDCSIGQMAGTEKKEDSYASVVAAKGYEWPFSLVREILEGDDFTFANSEVVFTERGQHQNKKTNLKAAPEMAKVYLFSGIDAVNTANNHAWDFYEAGYQDTLAALDALSIPHFGTLYPGTKHAYDHLGVYAVKGILIGALGISYPQDSDLKVIGERIAALREQGCALVVVCLHWGQEVQPSPNAWQFTYARKVIDLGADVLWGQHPHILQQVQFYQGKPIFYSTGNFTFGSMSAVDPDTGIFQLTYELTGDGPDLRRFTVIPCRTQGRGDYRPCLIEDEAEKRAMLKKLIYKRSVSGMTNLPAGFADTATVYIRDGEIIE